MTILTLRPNATTLDQLVTKVAGAGTAHGNTSDNSDTSYIVGTTNFQSRVVLEIADPTALTATQRYKQVRPRLRIFHNSVDSGWREYVTVQLRYASNGAVTEGARAGTVSNTAIDWTGPWYTAGPENRAWTQNIANLLQVFIIWEQSASGGAAAYLRVPEVYVDYDVNNQPTVSAVTPTNFTVTTMPNIAWTYADADGDPQTRWRAKVFRTSETVLTGFSAATSVADWDSGDQTGANTNVDVGASLLNGTSYTAYVKVGQDWPGPEGEVWWSSYVASSSFTISVTPPAASPLNISLLDNIPNFGVRLDTINTSNMLRSWTSDPTSTTTPSPLPWITQTNSSVAASTAQSVQGGASIAMTATAAAAASMQLNSAADAFPTVVPGQPYDFSVRARAAVTARTIRLDMQWINAAGGVISTTTGPTTVADSAANFTANPYVAAVAPAGARRVNLIINVLAAAAAEVHYFDLMILTNTVLTASGPQTYSPGWDYWTTPSGNTTQAPALRIQRYDAVAVNAPDVPTNLCAPNVASCGDTYDNTNGFGVSNAADFIETVPMDIATPAPVNSRGVAAVGARKIRGYFYSGVLGGIFSHVEPNAGAPTGDSYKAPAPVGTTVTAWVWAWTDSGTFSIRPKMNFQDGEKVSAFAVDGTTTVLTTTPQLIQMSAVVPNFATAGLTVVSAYVNYQNIGLLSDGTPVNFWGFGWTVNSVPVYGEAGRLAPWVWTDIVGASEMLTTRGARTSIYDYAAAPGRVVMYRVRAEAAVAGVIVASVWTYASGLVMTLPRFTLLKNPLKPEQALVAWREPEMSESQSESATIHYPLGASRPIKIRDYLGGHDGKLTLNYRSNEELRAIRDLYQESGALLIQWFNGGQTYILVTERTHSKIRSGWGTVELSYVESAAS